MHKFWIQPPIYIYVNMTYTRSKKYTNMMIGKHEIQRFKVVVVVLLLLLSLFGVFVLTSAQPLFLLDK